MKRYKLSISETLCKIISIDAESERDVRCITKKLYDSGEIVLSSDDYLNTQIEVIEEKLIK